MEGSGPMATGAHDNKLCKKIPHRGTTAHSRDGVRFRGTAIMTDLDEIRVSAPQTGTYGEPTDYRNAAVVGSGSEVCEGR